MNKQNPNPFIDDTVFISFLIVSAVPATIFSFFSFFAGENIIIMISSFVGIYLVASAHILVLGIPAYYIGERLNAIHWWTCILVGFLIGGSPLGIWDGWQSFILLGLFGASGGFVFWLLWQFWIHSEK